MTTQPVTLTETERESLAVACSSPTLPPEQAMCAYEEQVQRLSFAAEQILAARLSARDEEWRQRIEGLRSDLRSLTLFAAERRRLSRHDDDFNRGLMHALDVLGKTLLAQPTDGGK